MRHEIFKVSMVLVLALGAGQLRAGSVISLGGETYNEEELIREAEFYSQWLGLDENVYIRINFVIDLPEHALGTVKYDSTLPGIHQVMVYISKKASRASQLNTLAHEMVHVAQLVNQDLILLDNYKVAWKNEGVLDARSIPYHNRPWEIEAEEKSVALRRAYLAHRKALDMTFY